MQRLGLVLLAAFGVTTYGCAHGASAGSHDAVAAELGPVPTGAAQVCVVRPASRYDRATAVTMRVTDNGRLVGATQGATFFCYLARVGEHQIASSDDDTGPLLLRARPRARYWLHQDVVELAGEVHAHLDWVDESTGLEMLDACDARVRVAVPGHDDETSAQPIAPAKM
ncbi:MAG: hypothetical protein JWP87_4729 [Labilithrix sp.]|nr:hypothetical protein [Labilithrix sp.]